MLKNILRNLQGRVLIEIFALSVACLVVLPVWLPVLVGIADTGVNVLEEELSKTAITERPELFKAPPPELEMETMKPLLTFAERGDTDREASFRIVDVATGKSWCKQIEISPYRDIVMSLDLSSLTDEAKVKIRLPKKAALNQPGTATCTIETATETISGEIQILGLEPVDLKPGILDAGLAIVASSDEGLNNTEVPWEDEGETIVLKYTYVPTEDSEFTSIYLHLEVRRTFD